jgi:recombination protein RecA
MSPGRSRESSRSLVLARCSDWVTWRSRPAMYVARGWSIDLDRLTGIGGWPRGRICEVFGPESVGVTTLLVQTLAAAQQHGGIVAFVDVDRAFIPEYARRLGCAVEDIFIAQPDDGPMALEIVDALVRSGAFDAIVLDSVPALYSPVRDQEAVDARNESLESTASERRDAPTGCECRPTRTVVLFGNRRPERADSQCGR